MYSSSISVYGDRITNPHITTSDPINISFGDHYAKTKSKAESAIQNSALDWTIFRLTAIMGLNNHKISPLMFHMPLNTSIEICTPMDTARAYENGIEKRNEKKRKQIVITVVPKKKYDRPSFPSLTFSKYPIII